MYFLGIDLGTSSIKVALVESLSGKCILTLNEPEGEMKIQSIRKNWAEQNPNDWWKFCCNAIKKVISQSKIDAHKIQSIGISYQMHGLVVIDKNGNIVRNSIIWCDSRAVNIGKKSFFDLGEDKCISRLLNSPGNFTASKLKWVKDNEPEVYEKIYKYMLPGDYISFKLTGDINTTKNGLCEGVFWDYKSQSIADWLLDYYGISNKLTPDIVSNFSSQGKICKKASIETGLPVGIPIKYRAGDQPNNALSLNVFNPGEIAFTGGTSGVIYALTNNLNSSEPLRINHFAHVNYEHKNPIVGKLLCINGAGIQYRWLRDNFNGISYENMNSKASKIPIGSDGVTLMPFGNGLERMLNNIHIGTQFNNLNLNSHSVNHLYRASLEGIAFSFMYGMEILKNDNAIINVIRAGNDNLFKSEVFSNTIATLIGHEIEIYNTTGAIGAARASGLIGSDLNTLGEKITKNDYVKSYLPTKNDTQYVKAYEKWKNELETILK
tara:strand:+ start:56 stop:1534 length:1479 start_codon:yes stop_codon:yes gene_type:complete